MSKTSTDAKKIMLLHSEAKIEFFKKYLERYLRILYLAPTIAEINIFDVFCGTGINQCPGVRNLHTFVFIFEDGAWKLDDIYIYNDEFTGTQSLYQYFQNDRPQ